MIETDQDLVAGTRKTNKKRRVGRRRAKKFLAENVSTHSGLSVALTSLSSLPFFSFEITIFPVLFCSQRKQQQKRDKSNSLSLSLLSQHQSTRHSFSWKPRFFQQKESRRFFAFFFQARKKKVQILISSSPAAARRRPQRPSSSWRHRRRRRRRCRRRPSPSWRPERRPSRAAWTRPRAAARAARWRSGRGLGEAARTAGSRRRSRSSGR